MSILRAIFVSLALTGIGHAQALNENNIRANLLGLTLEGEYQSGAAWRETFHADGTTTYRDETATTNGRLEINKSQICFRYEGDASLSGGCFEVWQRGRNCFDFYASSESGQTIASRNQKIRALGWDARGWKIGADKGDCVADLIS